jgi:predicted phosphodiesterase
LRILVLSDVHGNLDALRAVLEHAGRWDAVWVLGDLVDYGPEPHEVVDAVRELSPEVIVRGNHDNAVAFGVDCFCDPRIHKLSVCTREMVSLKLLSREQMEWLRSLPIRRKVSVDGRTYYVVHGSPISPLYGYIRPDMGRDKLLRQLSLPPARLYAGQGRLVDADAVVVGHSHIPFSIHVESVRVLNPGSVGQPRDGDPRASYAILDTKTMRFEVHRVKYDVGKVLRKLEALHIPSWCLQWLREILLRGQAVGYDEIRPANST